MADSEHLNIFYRGTEQWNRWRQENPTIRPDLSGGDFSREDFHQDAVRRSMAGLVALPSILEQRIFRDGDFSNVNFRGAKFRWTTLYGSNFRNADLSGADLTYTQLIDTHLEEAEMQGCHVYGISAWNVHLTNARQLDLVITPPNEPIITVDNLEVAQFIYLLLHNKKIRDVLETITSKAVLILGRFTDGRKLVLDAIRDELRLRGYLPILFDFEKPKSRDLSETVSTLAHLARFIIADLTDPSSIPKELEMIVPTLVVPVQPILEGPDSPYSMFSDYWKYFWVLDVYRYDGLKGLLSSLGEKVIAPAEAKIREVEQKRKAIEPPLIKP